jgi:GNAT superfamily N-acetyltransferase
MSLLPERVPTAGSCCIAPEGRAIRVRPARLDADVDFMVAAVRQHLNPSADLARFEWLYRSNPDGAARAWIAEAVGSGEPIGMAAAFPRRVYLGGREDRAWVLGEFCLADRYRTLGPALQLQRACLRELVATGAALIYDLPGHRMLPVYRRLGLEPSGYLRRLARPLRFEPRLPEAMPRTLASAITLVGNAAWTLLDRGRPTPDEVDVLAQSAPFDEEYSLLAAQWGSLWGFCLKRSAGYLNWRYRQAPHRQYHVLAARHRGALAGYAVLERDGDLGWIVDLFAADDANTVLALVAAAVSHFRRDEVASATVALPDGHRWGRLLVRLGFRPRETSPFVACRGDGGSPAISLPCAEDWLVMQGDRDS